MERVIDKLVILACCIAGVVVFSFSTLTLVAGLLAITTSALQELDFIPKKIRDSISLGYLVLTLIIPEFVLLMPLVAYDSYAMKFPFLRVCWIIPVALSFRAFDLWSFFIIVVSSVIAVVLAWRTNRITNERMEFMSMRDELRELSLSLETKNHSLQEKQDYEVRLATLSERGRIAREIHDNVGHLLTRSVLQIEALQVVHAEDDQVKGELEQVGTTLHQALETVRVSVHDLHDDSFDLSTQLYAIQKQTTALSVEIQYECEEVPPVIGYGFIAIVREAISNTLRHSDATRLKMSVVEHPAFWQLVVHDNGTVAPFKKTTGPFSVARPEGMPHEADKLIKESTGIGLKTMEDRARSLNGIFRIEYDRGMRIFVSVPKNTSGEKR